MSQSSFEVLVTIKPNEPASAVSFEPNTPILDTKIQQITVQEFGAPS
jgi:hypothetical protein